MLYSPFKRRHSSRLFQPACTALILAGSLTLTGCFSGSSSSSSTTDQIDTNLFPQSGNFEATIRRTDSGVAHVLADDLGSAAFGHGYAQTMDNVCYLAEAFVKARSERAKFFGPGTDNANVINDFSFKAQRILSGAIEEYETLTSEGKAMIDGFTAGYNKYVQETSPGDLPSECRDQPWVREIAPTDLLAHYRILAQIASGGQFSTGAVFAAVPPGTDPTPTSPMPVTVNHVQDFGLASMADDAARAAGAIKNYNDTGLASNAWGIGSELAAHGKGALLANPHFPYTGPRRLYQVQMTVPGYLNVQGAGLLGTAIPLISFNENLAWSHTVSTSRRFTLYEHKLKDGDDLTYIKEGQERPITRKTFQIEVLSPGAEPVILEREFFFSEYGPMINANAVTDGGLPNWGDEGTAFSYRDANADAGRLLDTWLKMSRATNLDEFKQVFEECGTTLWTNTTYADNQGNAYYIDSTSVPNLSSQALGVIAFKRSVSPAYNSLFEAGLTLLDNTTRDDWVPGECGNGLVPMDRKPQLTRTDWVQNSNNSHWATNPSEFLTGFSPLFGPEKTQQNPRTRLGIKMLQNRNEAVFDELDSVPTGDDDLFSARNLIDVIYNNRSFWSELFLDELNERCTEIGATEVEGRNLTAACAVLATWDGFYNTDSRGAHIFRVFMANYLDEFLSTDDELQTAFDPADPVNTPSTPTDDNRATDQDNMLIALSKGVAALESANIALDVTLGEVQTYQPSGGVPPNGDPQLLSSPVAWHGGDGNTDGAFNAIGVVRSDVAEDTLFPRVAPSTIPRTGGLSQTNGEGWLMARGTSWHFGLEFTDNGPEAFGLVSYSQSTDSGSEFFNDQAVRYSEKNYRQFWFTEDDIQANIKGNALTISQ